MMFTILMVLLIMHLILLVANDIINLYSYFQSNKTAMKISDLYKELENKNDVSD